MAVAIGRTPVRLDGLRLLVPDRELRVIGSPEFESTTRRRLLDALPVGGVFVDVGAHVGTMALPAACRVGPAGHVHAVEPSPASAAVLAENAALNGVDNITVHGCAVGADADTRPFHLMDLSYLNGLANEPLAEPIATISIDVHRLDELIDAPRVDAVKIDVEGAELEVLAGMSGLVERNPGLVLCVEWNPVTMRACGHDPLLLIDALAALGFHGSEVIDESRGGRLRPINEVWAAIAAGRVDDSWWGNLIVRREAA